MLFCPQCGIANEDNRRQCFRCKTDLPAPAPQEPPGNGGAAAGSIDPYAFIPAPNDPYAPVRFVPPSRDTPDEAFLDQFSWAPGCWTYYLSRAMWMFLVMAGVVRLFDTLLGLWGPTIKSGDTAGGILALFLALIDIGAFFGLLVWAGRVSRRRRWEQLHWRDFEHFRNDEIQRQAIGIVCWGVQIVFLIGSVIAGLAGHT